MALVATDVIVVRNAVRPSQMQGSSCNQIHQWLSMVRPQHPQLLLHMETCRVKYVGPLGQLFIISRQWQDSSCSACLPALMNFGQCCSLSSKAILMLCHTVVRTKLRRSCYLVCCLSPGSPCSLRTNCWQSQSCKVASCQTSETQSQIKRMPSECPVLATFHYIL